MSDTFKTEVPTSNYPNLSTQSTSSTSKLPSLRPESYTSLRLPTSVNVIALREAFLSEAPFVTNSNRIFWRRMVDHPNFQNMLAISYHIISDCISENSVIDLSKLYHIHDIKLLPILASNLAEMYYSIKLREREKFFVKLNEILTYMVVNALRTSFPKHHRICQSIKFREILLDWYNELLYGIRTTDCHVNREWFFQDIYDIPILTTGSMSNPHSTGLLSTNNSSNSTSTIPGGPNQGGVISSNMSTSSTSMPSISSPTKYKGNNKLNNPNHTSSGIIRSKYTIALSPLIDLYTGHSHAIQSEVTYSLSLSHQLTRPLTILPTYDNTASSITMGRLKNNTLDYSQIHNILQSSKEKRKQILLDHKKMIKEANRDIVKYKIRYKKTLKALEQTNKETIITQQMNNITNHQTQTTSSSSGGGGGATATGNGNNTTATTMAGTGNATGTSTPVATSNSGGGNGNLMTPSSLS